MGLSGIIAHFVGNGGFLEVPNSQSRESVALSVLVSLNKYQK